MNPIFRIESVTQQVQMSGGAAPQHPLITISDLSTIAIPAEHTNANYTTVLYSIVLKTKVASDICWRYGRDTVDFQNGGLMAIAPERIMSINDGIEAGEMEGWALYFHPDLIRPYPLFEAIRRYGFFSYDMHESLHLSPDEQDLIVSIFQRITAEYQSNIDEYTNNVLVSNIELLLQYIQRYYGRQFITRKVKNLDVLSSFDALLRGYFESDKVLNGLSTVAYLAQEMHLSPSYLSDLLKRETGKTTQEHIHYELIERAKHHLLHSQANITEISFQLGFEYPQYFNRLFKKKTGFTPTQYRVQHSA